MSDRASSRPTRQYGRPSLANHGYGRGEEPAAGHVVQQVAPTEQQAQHRQQDMQVQQAHAKVFAAIGKPSPRARLRFGRPPDRGRIAGRTPAGRRARTKVRAHVVEAGWPANARRPPALSTRPHLRPSAQEGKAGPPPIDPLPAGAPPQSLVPRRVRAHRSSGRKPRSERRRAGDSFPWGEGAGTTDSAIPSRPRSQRRIP